MARPSEVQVVVQASLADKVRAIQGLRALYGRRLRERLAEAAAGENPPGGPRPPAGR